MAPLAEYCQPAELRGQRVAHAVDRDTVKRAARRGGPDRRCAGGDRGGVGPASAIGPLNMSRYGATVPEMSGTLDSEGEALTFRLSVRGLFSARLRWRSSPRRSAWCWLGS